MRTLCTENEVDEVSLTVRDVRHTSRLGQQGFPAPKRWSFPLQPLSKRKPLSETSKMLFLSSFVGAFYAENEADLFGITAISRRAAVARVPKLQALARTESSARIHREKELKRSCLFG